MKVRIVSLLAAFAVALVAGSAPAADSRGTREQATAMVEKAIALIKKQGREKAFATFDDHHGAFVDRDLYVVVYDLNGKVLAHGSNERMIGKDLLELRDVDGKYFVKDRVAIAKGPGKGWQDYEFMNPVSRKIEHKSMFIERFEDLIVGCGIYKG